MGDEFRIQRTYTALQVGLTINKAWLTVKLSDRDLDAAALFPSKVITTTPAAAGHITDDTTTDGALGMYFDLAKTDTILASPEKEYWYDVQVKVTDGSIHTMEKGRICFMRGVTDANS